MYGVENFQADFNVSRETLDKLQAYVDLLKKWQKKINLVAPSTVSDAWHRHIADSAQLFQHMQPAKSLVDIGSGAGFPAAVLAIMGAESVTMIESDSRKCAFLREVSRQTDTPYTVINQRIEEVTLTTDTVTARALADINALLVYTLPFMRQDSVCYFLKGRTAAEEIINAQAQWSFSHHIIPSVTQEDAVIVKIWDVNVSRET